MPFFSLERYFLRRATWLETVLFWLAALGLLWPQYWADVAGLGALAAALVLQKLYDPSERLPATQG